MCYDNDNCGVCGCIMIEDENDEICLNGACPTNSTDEEEKS